MKHRSATRQSWQQFGNRASILDTAVTTIGGTIPGLGILFQTLRAGSLAGGLFGWSFPTDVAGGVALGVGNAFSNFLLTAVNFFFFWLGYIDAQAINIFAVLNPFDANTLAPFIWNTFRNISYVGIIFFSLYSGFLWILGRDGPAKELLTKLLIVALVMNFFSPGPRSLRCWRYADERAGSVLLPRPKREVQCRWDSDSHQPDHLCSGKCPQPAPDQCRQCRRRRQQPPARLWHRL